MSAIAFIGLGNMGRPMAANLVKAGHEVLGVDLVPALSGAAARDGVVPVDSAVAAVARADVAINRPQFGVGDMGDLVRIVGDREI